MVRRIYSWADEADLVDEGFNPAARLKKPKAKVTQITIWSDEEISLFRAKCETFMLTVLLLALYTGQRRQELEIWSASSMDRVCRSVSVSRGTSALKK